MPQIVVRPYEERDRERYFHVRAMTWNNGRPIPVEEQYFRTSTGYSADVDGLLAGCYASLDFTCTRGNGLIRCAAIAGVAVLPEYRQLGIGGSMMRWALHNLRSQGYPIASLYAFKESYYRKFGYSTCGVRYSVEMPCGRYPKLIQELPISIVKPEAYGRIKEVYEAFARRRSGMNIRTPLHWERVLGKEFDNTIYVAGDPAEAYMVIKHNGNFWNVQEVSELIWSTKQGYDTILSLLTGIGINKNGVKWNEPSDSPFLAQHLDQSIEVKWDRSIMYRVLDVPAALKGLKPEGTGSFTIGITDEHLRANEGPWHVAFSPNGVEVTEAQSADLTLDIRQFTQALLGQPSLACLANNDLLTVDNAAALVEAMKLLPPMPTYCADFF